MSGPEMLLKTGAGHEIMTLLQWHHTSEPGFSEYASALVTNTNPTRIAGEKPGRNSPAVDCAVGPGFGADMPRFSIYEMLGLAPLPTYGALWAWPYVGEIVGVGRGHRLRMEFAVKTWSGF